MARPGATPIGRYCDAQHHHLLLSIIIILFAFTLEPSNAQYEDRQSLVVEPSDVTFSFDARPYRFAKVGYFNITAELHLAGSGCDPSQHVAGTISFIVPTPFPCTLFKQASLAFQAGAVAVVFQGDLNEGSDVLAPFVGDDGSITIPVTVIPKSDGALLLQLLENGTVVVQLFPGHNPWLDSYNSPGFIAGQVLVGIAALSLLIFLIYKNYLFIKFQGCQASISQAFLWLSEFAIFLICVEAVDMLSSRGFFYYWFSLFVPWIVVPIAINCNWLIAFFWLEAISLTSKESFSPFLSKHSSTFGGITIAYGIFFAASLGVILSAGSLIEMFHMLFGVISVCGMIVFIVFYIFVTVKLTAFIDQFVRTAKKKQKLLKLKIRVSAIVTLIIIQALLSAMLLPLHQPILWGFLSFFVQMLIVLIQAISLDPRLVKKSSSTSSRHSNQVQDATMEGNTIDQEPQASVS